mgnify:CR=1 FL=1
MFLDGVLHTGAPLPRDQVGPGRRVVFSVDLRVPDAPGPHRIALDLVEQEVAYFSDRGVPAWRRRSMWSRTLRVERSPRAPIRGVLRLALPAGAAGRRAAPTAIRIPASPHPREGCRLVDVDGRRYVDYVMGWGSAWLGYAHRGGAGRAAPRALERRHPTLTHRTQIEVAGACAR